LIAPTDVTLAPHNSVLMTGPSGSGKSTLFRAFAGIWPFGSGTVQWPAAARVLFLPQKPYLGVGTLRDQLMYPAQGDSVPDGVLNQALLDCGLPQLAHRLDEEQNWAQVLSGGEQQRVALRARCFTNRSGCSWMRPPPRSTMPARRVSTLCYTNACRIPVLSVPATTQTSRGFMRSDYGSNTTRRVSDI